jgi:hypothetical protein
MLTKEEKSKYDKIHYLENRERILRSVKERYYKNRTTTLVHSGLSRKDYLMEWAKKNREHINKRNRERLRVDIHYALKRRLGNRIRMAFKSQSLCKRTSAIRLLGCPIETAREHIERQFQSGMSWDNHGQWHVDHIIPTSSFDLSREEEQLKAFHYTNLQPLWAEDNIRKSNKLISIYGL